MPGTSILKPSFSSQSSSSHLGETIPPINILVGVRGPGELAADEVGLNSEDDRGPHVAGIAVGVKKEEGVSYAEGEN